MMAALQPPLTFMPLGLCAFAVRWVYTLWMLRRIKSRVLHLGDLPTGFRLAAPKPSRAYSYLHFYLLFWGIGAFILYPLRLAVICFAWNAFPSAAILLAMVVLGALALMLWLDRKRLCLIAVREQLPNDWRSIVDR